MGTPDFAIPSLEALIRHDKFNISSVFTQPDKKIGRKQILNKPPVKILAEKNNISVYQPTSLKKFFKDNPLFFNDIDLIIVVAYAQILPQEILDSPKYGAMNIHASLLPRYRGSSCIQAAILNDDRETGITIMKMDEGLDTGDIIQQRKFPISKTDDTGSLFEKTSQLGADIICQTVINYINGETITEAQDNSKSTLVKKTSKKDGIIDWSKNAEYIDRQFRAMNPWPGIWTKWNNKILKILDIRKTNNVSDKHDPGSTFIGQNGSLSVVSGENTAIEVLSLQLEGKKPLSANDFLKGNQEILNSTLK